MTPAGNRKVLMGCCNHWRSPFQVGSHHIARSLASCGYSVAFVSDPLSPLHLLGGDRQILTERYELYRKGGETDLDGSLWSYVPGALLTPYNRPLLRADWVHRLWPSLSFPDVRRVVRDRGFGTVDLLYLDSVAQHFWLGGVRSRVSVLRIADSNAGFSRATPAMQRIEAELAGRVDAVIYTAANMSGYIHSLAPKRAIYFPNGVRYAHFAEGGSEIPEEYRAIPRPIAVYVGAMDAWFDFELVQAAAEALPRVSFALIGPDELARKRLSPRPNLHLLGRKPFARLPAFLHNADAGIIPFDVKGHAALVNTINPLKLYEYLACGLPVVSVDWEALRLLDSPAALCGNRASFVDALGQAVSRPSDRARLQEYARGRDWDRLVAGLLRELGLESERNPR